MEDPYELMFRDPRTPLTQVQKWLRRKVRKIAKNEPQLLRMETWGDGSLCDTPRCIAGWAQFLMEGTTDLNTVKPAAIKHLGLTRDEYYALPGERGLFYVSDSAALKRLDALVEATR